MPEPPKRTVLVIEDDPDIQFIMDATLDLEGYQAKAALNGAEALDLISREGMPDLILLDMKMPVVMDGWQFAAVFDSRYGRKVPIVVMTAAADAAKRADDIRADAWLGKPFQLAELRAVLQRFAPRA